MYYRKAIVKFNNGNGALLCNGCLVVMAVGFEHEDREHLCPTCTKDERRLEAREALKNAKR